MARTQTVGAVEPILSFFGNRMPSSERLARQKFRDCPWPHFDGVPDPHPNRVLASDFAVTLTMGSGVRSPEVRSALRRDRTVERLLARLPAGACLEDTAEEDDPIDWLAVDGLCRHLSAPGIRLSRTAKMLCRKRPGLVPMLDAVVQRFLRRVARDWHRQPPDDAVWFDVALWNSWTSWTVPSPFIRMIRHDMRHQLPALRELRRRVAADPVTEVPADAPLLRLYEATLWAACLQGVL